MLKTLTFITLGVNVHGLEYPTVNREGEFTMKKVLAATLVTGLVLLSAPAFAVLYKNPAHSFSQGKFGVGVSFESFSRDVESDAITGTVDLDIDQITANFTIGLGTGGALGLHAGLVDAQIEDDPSSDGAAFGISYRHNLDPDGGKLQKGFFLSFRSAFVDNEDTETDATQFDGGFGVALPLADNAALYGGGVLSTLDLTIEAFSGGAIDAEASDTFGFFVGVEFTPAETVLLGIEVHAIHESGFAFYIDALF